MLLVSPHLLSTERAVLTHALPLTTITMDNANHVLLDANNVPQQINVLDNVKMDTSKIQLDSSVALDVLLESS